jgi:hypothetical protein
MMKEARAEFSESEELSIRVVELEEENTKLKQAVVNGALAIEPAKREIEKLNEENKELRVKLKLRDDATGKALEMWKEENTTKKKKFWPAWDENVCWCIDEMERTKKRNEELRDAYKVMRDSRRCDLAFRNTYKRIITSMRDIIEQDENISKAKD